MVEDPKTPPEAAPKPEAPETPAVVPDVVGEALAVPAAVYEEKKDPELEPSGIEVVETHVSKGPSGATIPGVGSHGLVLDHRMYVQPDASKDYRWGTLDGRRTGRNRARGFTPVTVGGRDVVAGGLQLLHRPKELAEAHERELEFRARAAARKANPDQLREKMGKTIVGKESITIE